VPPEELLELLELEEELDELLDELEPRVTLTDELTTSLPPARLIITA
jgi:ribosome assembly protein YihI (activator of Der GTPase)